MTIDNFCTRNMTSSGTHRILKLLFKFPSQIRLVLNMSAIVIARRHRRKDQSIVITEPDADIFVENLPPVQEREFDEILGTLLVGCVNSFSQLSEGFGQADRSKSFLSDH